MVAAIIFGIGIIVNSIKCGGFPYDGVDILLGLLASMFCMSGTVNFAKALETGKASLIQSLVSLECILPLVLDMIVF